MLMLLILWFVACFVCVMKLSIVPYRTIGNIKGAHVQQVGNMNADQPSDYPAPPNLPFHVAKTLGNIECWVRWCGVTIWGHF